MTRTNKWTVHEAAGEPKWFTHNGHYDADPTKIRKNGAGRNNWGRPGDEMMDDEEVASMSFFGRSARRNSNHMEHEENLRRLNMSLDAMI